MDMSSFHILRAFTITFNKHVFLVYITDLITCSSAKMPAIHTEMCIIFLFVESLNGGRSTVQAYFNAKLYYTTVH